MDLDKLADFHRVVVAGSLGKASREYDRPKATLSRRIRDLEVSLGVRLLERGPRSLNLTTEGQQLYERTRDLLRELEDVGRDLSGGANQPCGLLRISAPVLFSEIRGGCLAAEFAALYPKIELQWQALDRPVDLAEEACDVVIRINPDPASELVGRCFARDTMLLVAPPDLPKPDNTADRVPAVTIAQLADTEVWRFEAQGRTCQLIPDYRLVLSSLTMVRAAVLAGAGAALLPRSLAAQDIETGRLTLWGHDSARPVELWALHSSRRLVSPKVSAFMAFLKEWCPGQTL